jgi:anti-sigma regulatory factor (Ser/Thr protein kinase)
MIDLAATRTQLLAEIGASRVDVEAPLEEPTDPRFLDRDEVCLRVRGHARDDLFPVLEVVLSARFAGVPRPERIRELLAPLKNALGNAYKHGNHRDRSKWIEVEIAATRRGALVEVRDQGAGFDAGRALALLRAGEHYYVNYGVGLRTFDRISSRVAWEDGGRTLLLRFLAADAEEGARAAEFGRTPRGDRRPCAALDLARIQSALPRRRATGRRAGRTSSRAARTQAERRAARLPA